MVIVDTNQADRIPPPARFAQNHLCVPELVLAEVGVRPSEARARTFKRWRQYNVRLGLQPSQVMEELAGLSAEQIRRYRPFADPLSTEAGQFARALRGKLDDGLFRPWAEAVRRSGLAFGAAMQPRAITARGKLKQVKAGKAADMDEAVGLMAGASSYIGELMISSVRNGGARSSAVSDDDELYAAILANPHLRNFARGLLYYSVAISRAWDEQKANLDPIGNRNDFTDLSLPLYVRDNRDIVWTEDAFARRVLASTDSGVRLRP